MERRRRRFLKTAVLVTTSIGISRCQIKPSQQPLHRSTGTIGPPTALPIQIQSASAVPSRLPTDDSLRLTQTPAPDAGENPAQTSDRLAPLSALVHHRLQFGPRPGEREEFETSGAEDEVRLNDYLDAQLHPEQLEDREFEEHFQAAGFETLHKTLEELASDHILNNPFPEGDDRHWQWFIRPVDELVEATFLRAVYSRRQLFEIMVDFWHNHFNVFGWQDDVTPLFVSYDRDVIRKHALGNFRQFLEAVATHPAMLFYLDNRSNSDGGPNENFARELFELYTLGAENYLGVGNPQDVPLNEAGLAVGYVDNDVYETARCFTGWRVDDDHWDGENDIGKTYSFRYYRPWHDRYNKWVLGQYFPADQADQVDGRTVLDLLSSHPGTAHFVAGKLCRRLVADQPSDELIQGAAEVFLQQREAPDQIAQVIRFIVTAQEFRTSWRLKVKRPFELAVAAMRALQADFVRLPGGVRWTYEQMGQPLFGHRSPNGYADRMDAWANTMVSLYSWNLVNGLVNNWWRDKQEGGSLKTDVAASTPSDLTSAGDMVDAWLARLELVDFPEQSRQAVIDFLNGNSGQQQRERLSGAIGLLLMSPDFRCR